MYRSHSDVNLHPDDDPSLFFKGVSGVYLRKHSWKVENPKALLFLVHGVLLPLAHPF